MEKSNFFVYKDRQIELKSLYGLGTNFSNSGLWQLIGVKIGGSITITANYRRTVDRNYSLDEENSDHKS